MAKVIILGSSNAVPSRDHENTHLVIIGKKRAILVDCVSNPIIRLEQAGVDFNELTDIIITHFHPDHVSGVPLLLMDMWLLGRTKPINIYGLHFTMDRLEDLMGFYGWADWPNFFPVAFYRLPESEMAFVLDCDEFKVTSSPVHHIIPTIGIRVEAKQSGKVLAYSCDTEPCEQTVRLADGADILIHEAGGAVYGHSSAEQAGEIAARAEVDTLYLIHYPTGRFAKGDLAAEARKNFQGDILIAKDFMTIDL
ncbi:MAG: MBL fold metallo-hydrolase [Chloroflexota bacterium]|nr:MBL fold metallo-hydrolase [Chloroflexota bacterium]MBI5703509.1 MBL fold metallo-hydrolase [Chloroflexota bacterium]